MEGTKKPPSPKCLVDAKGFPSFLRTRRTMVFAYGFMVAFILCTGFLAVAPSVNSSFWFSHFFSFRTNTPISSSASSSSSYSSSYSLPFSSIFSYIFPDSSSSSAKLDASEKEGSHSNETVRSGGSPVSPKLDDHRSVSVPSSGSGSRGNGSAPAPPLAPSPTKTGEVSGNKTSQTGKDPSGSPSRPPVVNPVERGEVSGNRTTQSGKDLSVSPKIGNGMGNSSVASGRGDSPVKKPDNSASLVDKNLSVSPKPSNGSQSISVASGNTSSPVAITRVKTDSGNVPTNLVGKLIKPPERISAAATISSTPAKSLARCDIFDGRWVKDDSYPLYSAGSCPFIDEPFDCYLNGRPERHYEKWRWQPKNCNIPRLDPKDMLQRLRGKRLVFIGDSLNRNMWESLVCTLRNSIKDKKRVFEVSGRLEFRTEGSYAIRFPDYNCSVEFFRSPFLVQEWETPEPNGTTKETLRLDIIERSSSKYKNADILVFNTGHWWTHEKTSKGKDYYQEGNRVYVELDVDVAFKKALKTWAKWVDTNVNPKKTLVFFRGYSSSHFSGGRWNSGGQCDNETEPITKDAYLAPYPPKMKVLESVISGMKTPISYLNITRMTDYRKDAHPSIYRKRNLSDEERRAPERFQDCSHWCLPGLPESWNELLYAELVRMGA